MVERGAGPYVPRGTGVPLRRGRPVVLVVTCSLHPQGRPCGRAAAPRPGRNRDNHQMDLDRLDPEGYIRPEADLANVQPQYQGVPDAAAGLLADEFGPRLHSAYLYGSVVGGNAVPGRSDVDLAAVLLAAPTDEDRTRADRAERALVDRFPVLFGAGVGLTHLQEVRSPAQRYAWQVFLRELAVCICGEDLRPGLPRTRPSAAVAAGFHDDTHAVFARRRRCWAPRPTPRSSGASAGWPRGGWCRWRSRS
jgi:hypothetical protein